MAARDHPRPRPPAHSASRGKSSLWGHRAVPGSCQREGLGMLRQEGWRQWDVLGDAGGRGGADLAAWGYHGWSSSRRRGSFSPHLSLQSSNGVKYSFSFISSSLCHFSGVFQGDDRAFDLLLLQRAMQRKNLFPCFLQPGALCHYVSFLIYRPPSLMTHSGRDLFVVSMTPTSVNKASLPSHQSGSYR